MIQTHVGVMLITDVMPAIAVEAGWIADFIRNWQYNSALNQNQKPFVVISK